MSRGRGCPREGTVRSSRGHVIEAEMLQAGTAFAVFSKPAASPDRRFQVPVTYRHGQTAAVIGRGQLRPGKLRVARAN